MAADHDRMKVSNLLFSAPMIKALLDGRKTQTRRIMKGPPCPWGGVGDLIWVRETLRLNWLSDVAHHTGQRFVYCDDIYYAADHVSLSTAGIDSDTPKAAEWIKKEKHQVNSIFMPRWASRITLKLTNVYIEQLQDISEDDAGAEGCSHGGRGTLNGYGDEVLEMRSEWFRRLWDSINAKNGFGWETNPLVWALTFEVHKCNVDHMP